MSLIFGTFACTEKETPMANKKVLYISQEIFPYLPETDLAHVSRFLPEHIQNAGHDVRIFMPRYGLVNERRNQLHEVIRLSGINIIVDDTDHPLIIKVASIPSTRIQVYFIDNEEFFGRKTLFGPSAEGAPSDNADRSIFFIRGVLEAIKMLRWMPDMIHCMGWFSALAPVYLKTAYKDDPYFEHSKVLFSLDGNEEEGEIGEELIGKLEFDKIKGSLLDPLQGEVTPDALRRMAIHYADGVVLGQETVSPNLIKYLKGLDQKKILEYPGPAVEHAEEYVEFYRSIY